MQCLVDGAFDLGFFSGFPVSDHDIFALATAVHDEHLRNSIFNLQGVVNLASNVLHYWVVRVVGLDPTGEIAVGTINTKVDDLHPVIVFEFSCQRIDVGCVLVAPAAAQTECFENEDPIWVICHAVGGVSLLGIHPRK